MLFLISFPYFQFIRNICKTRFSLGQKTQKMLKTKKLPWQPLLFSILKVSLLARLYPVWAYQKILPKEIEEIWNQSQTDVKKCRCLSSFNVETKSLDIRGDCWTVNVGLVCYVSVALIAENSKKNENINFRLRSLARASWSCITLLSHLNSTFT